MLVPRKVFVIHLDVKIRLHFRPNGSNLCPSFLNYSRSRWGWTLKCWESPTTLGFPTKKWSWLGVFWGVPPFKETLRCFCQTKIFSNFPGLHFSDLRLSVTTWFMHEKLKLKRTVSDWKEPKINGSIRISVTSFFPTKNKKEWLKIRSFLKTEQTSHIPSLFLAEIRKKIISFPLVVLLMATRNPSRPTLWDGVETLYQDETLQGERRAKVRQQHKRQNKKTDTKPSGWLVRKDIWYIIYRYCYWLVGYDILLYIGWLAFCFVWFGCFMRIYL